MRPSGAIRVVNYHNTPFVRAAQYEREFAALADRYAPVDEDTLAAYLATGRWGRDRPGVIPAFYNGYRNNFDVARAALARTGLVGWFFCVPNFTDCPVADQRDYATHHNLSLSDDGYRDGRVALSWDEIRLLDRSRHVVASHTRSHTRVALDDAAMVEDEIVGAQSDFCRELGHPVRSFAWLFGGRYGENPVADAAVDRAGYEFLFSNLAVQRLRPAARAPMRMC